MDVSMTEEEFYEEQRLRDLFEQERAFDEYLLDEARKEWIVGMRRELHKAIARDTRMAEFITGKRVFSMSDYDNIISQADAAIDSAGEDKLIEWKNKADELWSQG